MDDTLFGNYLIGLHLYDTHNETFLSFVNPPNLILLSRKCVNTLFPYEQPHGKAITMTASILLLYRMFVNSQTHTHTHNNEATKDEGPTNYLKVSHLESLDHYRGSRQSHLFHHCHLEQPSSRKMIMIAGWG